jgi:Flp pilus assembly protein TadD
MNTEGEGLFERGDVPGAAEAFREAVRMDPGNAGYRNNLAWALFQAGDTEGAAGQIDQVLRLDPNRAIAYANLGEIRRARGDRAGAIAAYRRFLQLNTDPRRERIAQEKLQALGGG